MTACGTPLAAALLLDYWAGDVGGPAADRIEEHLFTCADCTARLEGIAALGTGIAGLVRAGRVAGVISRSLLNRMQRDGVNVRTYTLAPGETVPCAAFPGDDLLVAALRADLAGVAAVTVALQGPDAAATVASEAVPIHAADGEVLWATPGAVARQLPAARLRLTLRAADAAGTVLGEYVLDHSAT